MADKPEGKLKRRRPKPSADAAARRRFLEYRAAHTTIEPVRFWPNRSLDSLLAEMFREQQQETLRVTQKAVEEQTWRGEDVDGVKIPQPKKSRGGRVSESSLAGFAVLYYHLLHDGAVKDSDGLYAQLMDYAARNGLPHADKLERSLRDFIEVALMVQDLPGPNSD